MLMFPPMSTELHVSWPRREVGQHGVGQVLAGGDVQQGTPALSSLRTWTWPKTLTYVGDRTIHLSLLRGPLQPWRNKPPVLQHSKRRSGKTGRNSTTARPVELLVSVPLLACVQL